MNTLPVGILMFLHFLCILNCLYYCHGKSVHCNEVQTNTFGNFYFYYSSAVRRSGTCSWQFTPPTLTKDYILLINFNFLRSYTLTPATVMLPDGITMLTSVSIHQNQIPKKECYLFARNNSPCNSSAVTNFECGPNIQHSLVWPPRMDLTSSFFVQMSMTYLFVECPIKNTATIVPSTIVTSSPSILDTSPAIDTNKTAGPFTYPNFTMPFTERRLRKQLTETSTKYTIALAVAVVLAILLICLLLGFYFLNFRKKTPVVQNEQVPENVYLTPIENNPTASENRRNNLNNVYETVNALPAEPAEPAVINGEEPVLRTNELYFVREEDA